MKSYFCLILLVFGMFTGCSNDVKKPKHLIPESQYVDLLIELQLVRSYGENAKVDSVTIDSLTTAVFKKYGTTAETFQKSHRYYEQFPEEQKKRVEKAIDKLKMDRIGQADEDSSKTSRHH